MFPKSTRILIVDDMPAIRELLRSYLKELGYLDVMEASNGREAIQELIKSQAQGSLIHLVIADWNMPEMDGLALLKEVRESEHWSEMPFILLTSESEKSLVTQAIMAGVSQYIVKPFSQKIVAAKMQAVWEKLEKIAKGS